MSNMKEQGKTVLCSRHMHFFYYIFNIFISFLRDALKAYREFQGRWYGGKQLNVEFSGVASWKRAICGMLAVFLENIYGILWNNRKYLLLE